MRLPELQRHPQVPGRVVRGVRLEVGEILQQGDLYSSTTGRWTETPVHGVPVVDNDVVWVRPTEDPIP